jgi:hypothetical protein
MRAFAALSLSVVTLAACITSGTIVHETATTTDAGTPDAAPVSTVDAALPDAAAPAVFPPFLPHGYIAVSGHDRRTSECRSNICRHNENTDMISWNGAIWLVHRTAMGQVLGPNSALHVYKSTDNGITFQQTALIPAPTTRDIRDPCFYVVGNTLHIKALTRLPSIQVKDTGVDTIAVNIHSTDGVNWTDQVPIGPETWSFWRIKEYQGTYYTAAYEDGDQAVQLFTSTDGLTWTAGAMIYSISTDTPLETELTFMPSGRLLALVRMDGSDPNYLLGDQGPLRTKICWATAPYTTFDCPQEFDDQRLDGPLSFFWNQRLFVIARRHLEGTGEKRTSLFEITGAADGGTLDGGPLDYKYWGDFPSAGDTSYAGIAFTDADHAVTSWYSSDLAEDEPWAIGIADLSDIWLGYLDFTKL